MLLLWRYVLAECQILDNKNDRSSNVLVTLKSQCSVVENHHEKDQYNPFISTGYASLSENSKKLPIEILQN